MNSRTRFTLLLVSAALGAVASVLGALALLLPQVLPHSTIPGLAESLVGVRAAAVVDLAAGLAAVAVAALALRRPTASPSAPTALRIAAMTVAFLVAACTPGGIIPAAGYSFVLVVAAGVVAMLVLLFLRRRLIGILMLAVGVSGVVLVSLWLPLGEWLPLVLVSLGQRGPLLLVSVAHLATAGALAAWVLGDPRARSGFARGVRRHRTVLTVAAALCAMPYAVARAGWLTPWKLFGGDAAALQPIMLLTGLLLGSAMLAAGVLTLMLCLPWSDRFPRWMGGIGGRPVPVGLVVIPASFVAVMFTTGGWEMVFWQIGRAPLGISTVELLLVLPFWLWGPLLALATWGYALHRGHTSGSRQQRSPRAVGDPGLSEALQARATRELETIEQREPQRG